jgi:hypothetical protein
MSPAYPVLTFTTLTPNSVLYLQSMPPVYVSDGFLCISVNTCTVRLAILIILQGCCAGWHLAQSMQGQNSGPALNIMNVLNILCTPNNVGHSAVAFFIFPVHQCNETCLFSFRSSEKRLSCNITLPSVIHFEPEHWDRNFFRNMLPQGRVCGARSSKEYNISEKLLWNVQ